MGYIFYPSGGKFHVSLGLPGQDSVILKGIGKEGKTNFLVPNIPYIIQCAVQGELGIADSLRKAKAVYNLNKCKSPETLKFLSKSLGLTIDGDPEKWKTPTGYAIPSSAVFLNNSMSPITKASLGSVNSSFENQNVETPHIEIPKSMEDVGLKAIEKAIIKSYLEQYKPFIEIAKLLIQHLAQIEDVAARVMAIGGPSKIPKVNGGVPFGVGTGRPKALGFGGGADIKSGIGKIDSLNKKMEAKKLKRYGGGVTASISPTASNSNGFGTNSSELSNKYEYQILSTIYSTGKFDPYVDYNFVYIDIDDDDLGQLDDDFNGLDFEDTDPNKDKRPESIIFGFYDSKGNQIEPSSNIQSYIKGTNGDITFGEVIDVDAAAGIQGIQKADWIERQRNVRWFGNFGTRGAIYKWEDYGDSPTNPSGGDPYREYKQLFYDGTDRNNQTTNPTNNGEPNSPVLSFSDDERSEYVDLLMTTVDYKFNKLEPGELTPEEKVKYRQKINDEATQNVQAILEGMTLYGFIRSMKKYGAKNPDGTPASIPTNLLNSYRPRKITIANGEQIWIDPEVDYDMKLIRVDPITKIKYQLPGSPTEREAEILRFVKNTVEISISDNSSFNIDVIRNITTWQPFVAFTTPVAGRYENIKNFTFDNWNYKTGEIGLYSVTPDVKLDTSPTTLIRIWNKTAPIYWSNKSLLTWINGSDNYIFKKLTRGSWKVGRYEEVINNYNESRNNWGTTLTEFTLDDTLSIKVRDVYSGTGYSRYYYDNIYEWYYEQSNGIFGWTSSAPPSLNTKDFLGIDSTTNTFESVKVVNSGDPKEVNDPGDVLITETTKYKITIENNAGVSGVLEKQYKFSIIYSKITQTYKTLDFPNTNITFFNDANTNLNLGNRFRIPLEAGINKESTYVYLNQNNILEAWEYLFFDSSDGTEGGYSIGNFLPTDISKKITWTLNAPQIGRAISDTTSNFPVINSGLPGDNNVNSRLFIRETTTIPPNQIRLKEPNNPFGALLDPRRVVNKQLYEENPLVNKYSADIYGQSVEGDPTKIGIAYRYMKSEYDTETYYIVEGILPSINTGGDGGSNQSGGNNSNDSGGYYKIKDFLGAIKVFISVLCDIFSKLIPAIKKLISLFKNPANFIVDIIKEKLGESMKVFSPEFLNDYKQMIALPKLDPNTGENLRKEFAKNSSLNEYIFVSPTGDYKVLFDGAALKKLEILGLTIIFGIEVNHKKPVPIKLIFKIDLKGATENSLQSILNGNAKDQNLSGLGNINNPNSNGNNPSSGSIDQVLNGESVSIVYSTGKYIEGINYKYIYVTEYVSGLVNEANQLAQSDDIDDLNKAMRKYDEALQADPTNTFILDKLKELMNKIPNYMSSLMELLLALITAPLKLVTQVVEYIIGVFTNLSFGSFIPKIIEFLSFTWLITSGPKIFGPANLFKVFGLETLPLVLPPPFTDAGWSQAAALMALYKAGVVPPTSNIKPQFSPYPTDRTTPGIDFTKVLSFTFGPFAKKPSIEKSIIPVGMASMSQEHILTIFKKSPNIEYDRFNLKVGIPPIMEIMSQFICLIEAFINALIDLFWAILGLELVIPPEKVHLKLCKKFSEPGLTPEEANSILNGGGSAIPTANPDDYSFIYTVTTKDGEVVSQLNDQQLQEWVSEHSDYQFEYEYNNNVDVKKIKTEPINNDSGDLYKKLGSLGLNTNPDSIPQGKKLDINNI